MTGRFTDQSLTWARYTDLAPYVAALDAPIDDLGVQVIAPTHGLPADSVDGIMPGSSTLG